MEFETCKELRRDFDESVPPSVDVVVEEMPNGVDVFLAPGNVQPGTDSMKNSRGQQA